ncbi:MAG: DUF1552 domain-containing protein [Planctomycetota bacterium]|nr:DUF1552 domain-containing protein [Planctomycetota bacterium]
MNTRRNFIKSSTALLGLPWLESLGGFAHAAGSVAEPRRLLLISVPLGLYREAWLPKGSGVGYESSEYLSIIEEFRDYTTIISGLDHPGVGAGHASESRIFTGVPNNTRNALSLDQYLASKIGQQTRFDALTLAAGRSIFSWTASGTMVPAESKMSNVYARLFLDESEAAVQRVVQDISNGKSIMGLSQLQAKSLKPQLSPADQDKLEEYFETVRETERRLVKSEGWVHTPKPKVNAIARKDPAGGAEIITELRNVCDMAHLAFQTDSTRVVSFGYYRQTKVNVPGVTNGYHPLSHHGQDPNNIAQLKLIEKELFKELKVLLTKLKNTKEGDATLLDRTTIIVASNLGNASSHSTKDLPVMLIGGRYNHGQHLAFEPSSVPLSNLYVSVLNQFGLADKKFATSTGHLKGLELA